MWPIEAAIEALAVRVSALEDKVEEMSKTTKTAFENNDAKTNNRLKDDIYDWLCPVRALGHDPRLSITSLPRWHVSHEFPERVKDVWNLGQHASGDWMPKEQDRLSAKKWMHTRVTSS